MTDDDFYKDMKVKPLLDRLEWAAFKMCQRGHHEDFASDVMTEAKARIEALEKALFEITQSARLVGDWHHVKIARAALGMEEEK